MLSGVRNLHYEPFFKRRDLFEANRDGYSRYRIPGLIISPTGAVVVSCDARRDVGLGDWSEIDLFVRRSPDLGLTWEPAIRLVSRQLHGADRPPRNPAAAEQGLGAADRFPFNNQTLLLDRRTGDILFVYCLNYARCFQLRSSDQGATWSGPEEITAALTELRRHYPWKVVATGPNHGVQLASGRLVIPVWLSRGGGEHGHRPSVVSSIYSDDGGRVWHAGEIVAQETDPLVNPSETAAIELSDGGVQFNFRSESPQHRRAIAYSHDGATGWTRPEFVDDLAEPVCMAGMARLSGGGIQGRSRLLLSHCDNCSDPIPDHPSGYFKRQNLTIRLSYDEGRTWPVARVIEPGPAGYSDLGVGPDGTIFCFYERGAVTNPGAANQNSHLSLASFNLEWLTSGADSLTRR